MVTDPNFQDLVQQLDAIIWERQAETLQFTFISRQVETILGYPAKQWLNESGFFERHIHPDDLAQTLAQYRQAIQNRQSQEIEFRLIAADGNILYLRDKITPVFDPAGHLQRWCGFMVVIPAGSSVETQLEKSEQRFRISVENMLDCFGIYQSIRDQAGNIVDFRVEYLNAAACDTHQLAFAKQMGQRVGELLPAHLSFSLFEEYCRVVETGTPLVKEVLIYEDDDHQEQLLRCFEIRVSQLNDGFVATWRDITHRKQLEKELFYREQELEVLVQNMPVIIARMDRELRHVYVNSAIEFLTGIPAKNFIGKTHQELGMPADACQRWERYLTEVFTTAQELTVEFEIPLSNQTTRYYCSRMVPEFAEDGSVKFVLGVAFDITETKQAEAERLRLLQQLDQKQKLLEAVLQQMPAGVMVANAPSGQLVLMNEQVQQILHGHFPLVNHVENYLQFPFSDPEGKSYTALEFPLARSVLEGETITHEEVHVIRGDGSQGIILIDSSPINNEQGEIIAGVATFYDITEQKQTEAKLRASEERFRAFFDSAPIGLLVADLTYRIVSINQAICDLLGYTKEELSSLTFLDITHPEDIEKDIELYQQLLAGDVENYQLKKRYLHKNQESVWVHLTVTLIRDSEKQPLYGLGMAQDMTLLKTAQERSQLYADIVENVQVGLSVWQLENPTKAGSFKLMTVNPAAQKILGGNLESYQNMSVEESFPTLLATELIEDYRQVVLTQTPKDFGEIYYQGNPYIPQGFFSLKAFPLPNQCLGLAFENITERKQLEQALSESEQSFRFLADSIPQMVWTAQPDGWVDYGNRRWLEYTDLSLGETQGWGWQIPIHSEDRPRCIERWCHALTTGEPYEVECRYWEASAQVYHWHLVRAVAFRDSQGNILKWFGTCTNIDEQKRAKETAQFLSEASNLLAASLDYETTLAQVAHLAVPLLGDYCVVDLLKTGLSFERIVAVHNNPQKAQIALEIEALFPPDPKGVHPILKVLQTGEPDMEREITDEFLSAKAQNEEHLEMLRALGMKSHISVPLIAGKQIFGAISFAIAESHHRYGTADLALAEELAHRAALAISNAKLYQLAKAAEQNKDESLALLNAFQESAPIGLAFLDRQLHFIRLNEYLAQLNGLSVAEHIGHPLHKVLPPSLRETITTICQWVLEMNEPVLNIELVGETLARPEEQRYWLGNYYPVCCQAGEIMGIGITISDITELKQVEEALRKSEERFRVAQELSLDGFSVLRSIRNEQGKIIDFEWEYVNPTAANILRPVCPNVVGQRLLEILPSHQNNGLFDKYVEVVETGIAHDLEFFSDQEPIFRWFRNMAVKLQDGVAVSFSDITERKQIEEELHRRAQEFRALVENAPDIITRFDRQVRHLYVNPAIESITGIPITAFKGKTHAELGFPATVYQSWQDIIENIFTAKQGCLVEFELPTATGIRSYQARMVPEFALDGITVESVLGICRDVTELKQTEQALRDSETRFRRVFESNMIGMGFWDLTGQITEANDGLLQLLGYTREQLEAGQLNWRERTPVEYQTLPEHVLAEVFQFGYCTPYEKEFIRQDGTRIPVLIGGAVLEGKKDSGVFFVLDLTQQKILEATLRQQTEELATANRVKDEFLAVLSHELRSPLNAILGWAQMLRTRQLNPTTTARALETIERNARLQSQLIEDLLDVSRILRGKTRLDVMPVNLGSIIEAALDTVRLAAIGKSIEIQCLLSPDVGQVAGDSSRLQQIIWNLLSNAIKFTDIGGHVTVRLQQVGTMAQIQIQDTGIGINEQFLPYVFEYFRQADGTTTRAHGGLGLGLAIVKHLVELHGGTIQASSLGDGQGATFSVQFPLLNTEEVPATDSSDEIPVKIRLAEAPSNLPLQGLRILVVDDEIDARDYLSTALEESGALVATAASAKTALLTLEQFRPDILVSDIGMPEEDGYSLIRQVRTLLPEKGGQLPAIALTAYARDEDRYSAINAGFHQHLAKPVDITELVKMIIKLMRGK
jgi:PAS domain S-box-containing protein